MVERLVWDQEVASPNLAVPIESLTQMNVGGASEDGGTVWGRRAGS